MQKCERCNINDARVRLNSVTNGRREQHFYCRQCAEELLGQMNADASGSDFGGMFNSFFSNGGNSGMFNVARVIRNLLSHRVAVGIAVGAWRTGKQAR